MKKKILYSIYSAAFIGICLIPLAAMPFAKSESGLENRKLSEMPSLRSENGNINFDFFSEFETYFSEHFAFRQNLVTLDGKVRSEIMRTSSNEDVIVGKEGWLYYAPTADDFMNINTLSKRGVNNIVHNLLLFEQYCHEKDATFTFTIAPNKNSIYPEYMPYNYIETEGKGNYELFLEAYTPVNEAWMTAVASSQSDTVIPPWFNFVDLKSALLEAKNISDRPLYHMTDTHWNNLGALAGRNALIGGFKEDRETFLADAEWYAVRDWSGDLAEMLYPTGVEPENQYYCGYNFNYNYIGAFHGLDDITIKTSCEGQEGNLLMYRDSYGEAILPYMAESYGTAEFSRAVPYNTYQITEGTDVILEIVERNLGNLQKYAPVLPAPEYGSSLVSWLNTGDASENKIPEAEICSDSADIRVEESGSYFHIYGVLEDGFFSGDSARILVTLGDNTYEAFNCFEDKLLDREGEINDNGFSLYVSKNEGEAIPDKEDIIVTVISDDGKTIKNKER